MAKAISGIHDFIKMLTGKGQTGYHSPQEIDLAIHNASKTLFNEEYDIYAKTQKISDDLSVFLSDPTPLTLDVAGKSNKPASYLYLVGMRSGTNQVDVDVIEEAFLGNRRNDPNCPPALLYPICVEYSTYFQFYPIALTGVNVTFLKAPVTPVWAYTVVNNRLAYDDASSVDIEWNAAKYPRLMALALSYLGINLREGDMVQFAELQKKEL